MRILKTALSLLLLLTVSAGPASAAPAAFSEEDALAATEAIYAHLVAGEYEPIVEMLDSSIQAMVSAEALAAGYASEIAPNGDFTGIASNTAAASGDGFTVMLVANHAVGQAQLTCVFSAEGKITGIGIANLAVEETEIAEPLPLDLPEGAQERAVTLHAGTEKELPGALVLPADFSAETPFIVVAHGSGVSDMDETVGPNKLFRDIAYGLAEQGIASIRYDKLHFAHPELATADLTVDDEYTSTVLEALAVARSEEALGNAYLLGHSQGGLLTPYLMQKSEGGFSGGIILAGTPRQLWELMYDQNIALLEDAPEEQRAAAMEQLDAEKEKIAALDGLSEDELRTATVFGMPGPYIASLLSIDPIALAHENAAPLLILQGEEDFQVYLDVDFALWQQGLADMGDLVTYRSYPGLSHLFMEARGSIKDALDAYSVPDLVDGQVVADIAEWMHAQEK